MPPPASPVRRRDQLDDRVDLGVGQRRHETFGRLAGDGVDLHQLQAAAGGGDLVQPIAKGRQLVGRRRLAVRSA